MSDALFAHWRHRCEAHLIDSLAALNKAPDRLIVAMRHGVLGGGKRMRPLLVHATGHAFGAGDDALDHAAAAVEFIHAYSLVHDDLPAMDDDDLRRGQPTVHVAFDEATAILAGDALQSLAFQALTEAPLSSDRRIALLSELSRAAGASGMCGGQAIDLAATGQQISLQQLQQMHAMKTGALIEASVLMGAICADADPLLHPALRQFGQALGLAFQIRDDMLDVEAGTDILGKTAGKDAAADKPTYVSLLGLQGARDALNAERARIDESLSALPVDAALLQPLADLAALAVERSH